MPGDAIAAMPEPAETAAEQTDAAAPAAAAGTPGGGREEALLANRAAKLQRLAACGRPPNS